MKQVFRVSAPVLLTVLFCAVLPLFLSGCARSADANQFQVKLGGKILPPESHLGQVARGEKAITMILVQNVKPQG